jgi:hypothetical protein
MSDPGYNPQGRLPVFQRRDARARQVRKSRELGRVSVAAAPEGAEKREMPSRARTRQLRTTKQARAIGLPTTDVEAVAARPKIMVARARRVQSRQLAVLKTTLQPAQAEAIAAVPKVALRRVAQGRQMSARKLTARSRGSST